MVNCFMIDLHKVLDIVSNLHIQKFDKRELLTYTEYMSSDL